MSYTHLSAYFAQEMKIVRRFPSPSLWQNFRYFPVFFAQTCLNKSSVRLYASAGTCARQRGPAFAGSPGRGERPTSNIEHRTSKLRNTRFFAPQRHRVGRYRRYFRRNHTKYASISKNSDFNVECSMFDVQK